MIAIIHHLSVINALCRIKILSKGKIKHVLRSVLTKDCGAFKQCTEDKVISPTQYGFRENMSTCFALTELVDEITASLDKKLCTMGVFIDQKKPLTLWTINYCAKKLNFMASEVLH